MPSFSYFCPSLLCCAIEWMYIYIYWALYNEAVAMISIQIRDEYSNSLLYAGI